MRFQCAALCDIAGPPPFDPVRLDPACRTPTAVGVARVIYQEQRFEDLPVLADALEDAGCAAPGVLAHLRGAGPHTRGCWALTAALAKE